MASAPCTSGSAAASGTTGTPTVTSGSPKSGKSAYGSIGTAGTTGAIFGIATPSTSALNLPIFFLSSSEIVLNTSSAVVPCAGRDAIALIKSTTSWLDTCLLSKPYRG